MADFLSVALATAGGAMVMANIAVIAARLLHHDQLVDTIGRAASHVTWLFRMGVTRPDRGW